MSGHPDRRVFIVLGLYRPDPALFSRQLESLVSQGHRNFEVLVCADGRQEDATRAVVSHFSRQPVHLIAFDERVGVHANFARGLREAISASQRDSDLFAFSDQDDFWHPEKLARQVASFADGETSLCHSDARIVSREGEIIAPSLFRKEARSRSGSFLDLLVMNSVTGMTAVFRRDVALAAQSFPLSRSLHVLHDHWTALVASCLGTVRFIDAPLVDYTQHATNVLGSREWQGGAPRRGKPSRQKTYLRKCFREFLWRRQVLMELRTAFDRDLHARERLYSEPVRALFDCDSAAREGLALVLRHWLSGEWRQADQVWRIWRGRSVCCASRPATKAKL